MNKQHFKHFTLVAQLLVLGSLTVFWFGGQMIGPAAALTVPTRTPVPPPGGGSGGGGGGGGGSVDPTPIPPSATATPVTVITLAPTPVDGFITPETCGIPLFQASNGTVNVRATPAVDGRIVGQLVFLESRGISGRFAEEPWWQIVLADGTQGWVADAIGTVYGNTRGVPVLDEDGLAAQPQGWLPTPNPICPTLTPTVTPSVTPTPSPTATASKTPTATLTSEVSESALVAAEEPTTTNTPTPPTATALPEPSATTPATPVAMADGDPADPTLTAADRGGGVNLLLIGGVGLLLAGFAAFFVQRRGNPVP